MSRIGWLPVTIPSGVQVDIDGRQVTVQGPKGTLHHTVADPIDVVREDGVIKVTRPNDEGSVRALHGLSRTLIANMVTGVTDGYRKTLEIVGVGYRVQARGSDLEFSLGFSHPVTITPPEGITFRVEAPTRFVVEGIDKQQWARWPRKSASSASRTRIRARACGTRASRSAARSGRLEVSHGWHQDQVARTRHRTGASAHARHRGWAHPPAPAGPQEGHRQREQARLVVNRSARHMFAQIVDDSAGRTLAAASTLDPAIRTAEGDKTAKARQVGELLARRAAEAGIAAVVFDRGGDRYHGRVAALADAPGKADCSCEHGTCSVR